MNQGTSNPCSSIKQDTWELLRDIARMQMGLGLDYDSKFMEVAREKAEERLKRAQERQRELLERIDAAKNHQSDEETAEKYGDADLRDLEEELEGIEQEPRGVSREDYDAVLGDLEKQGLLDTRSQRPVLTSRGVQLLGQGLLSRILLNLEKKGFGLHRVEDLGEGAWTGYTTRPYQLGDLYSRIDILATLLETAARGVPLSQVALRDFRVLEARHSTELHFGVLVDQSASMRKMGKIQAANETAVALAEFMRLRYPSDRLRVFAFSEDVSEVKPWTLMAGAVDMRYTDIRAALRAYRIRVASLPGNKQANLITDSAPNYLDGVYVGFHKASLAVIEEARLYRRDGILLNIFMLDRDERLRGLAQSLARENLGRIFYVDPANLGEALFEDYLVLKRGFLRNPPFEPHLSSYYRRLGVAMVY